MAMGSSASPNIPFEPKKLISSGSRGMVYLAVRTDVQSSASEDKRNIIVKKINLAMEENTRKGQLNKLVEEMSKILALRHDNVIQHLAAYTVGEATSLITPTYCVLMEYCSGGTVHDAVAHSWLPPARLQKWTKEILEGLCYLHHQQIVHRDIKGDNVVLTTQNQETCHLKIIDLGDIKRLLTNVTQPKEVSHSKGTTNFMSPEMIQAYSNNVNIGRKTDIWSLGCLVIQMITGKSPTFTKPTSDGKRMSLVGEAPVMHFVYAGGGPDIPTGLPSMVAAFLEACLNRNPDERSSASDLLGSEFILGTASWTYPQYDRPPPADVITQPNTN